MILVTGAAGFIGTWLIPELRSWDHEVVGVDREFGGDLSEPGVFDRMIAAYSPDIVVHLAAKAGRLFCEEYPAETIKNNATATMYIAKRCGEAGIKLVYISTSEIYGDQGKTICEEDTTLPVLPHNLYGLTKRWGEEVARLYAPKGLLILRISMSYGPYQETKTSERRPEHRAAVLNFLWQAHHRIPMPVHIGAERSLCWIEDIVRGIRMLIEQNRDGTWNVGRDDEAVSARRIAEIACDLTGAPRSLIVEIPSPMRQTAIKRLSCQKLRGIGWRPTVDLEEGMRRMLVWVKTLPGPDSQ